MGTSGGTTRSKFAGGDQTYLRDEQYKDASKLTIRADVHRKYTVAELQWFDWLFPQFDLRAGHDVLEVGCGPGFVWEEAGHPTPADMSLTLTDLSPGMVAEARARVSAARPEITLSAREADAQELPFEDGTFDRVISCHMLYHLPEPERGVAEMRRVVRDEGAVIVATNGVRHMQEVWAIRAEVFDIERVDHTLEVFGADVGFPILRRHFSSVEWRQHETRLVCTDPADVVAYICSAPPGEDASPDQVAELRRLVDRAFAAGDGAMEISKDVGCFVCNG